MGWEPWVQGWLWLIGFWVSEAVVSVLFKHHEAAPSYVGLIVLLLGVVYGTVKQGKE